MSSSLQWGGRFSAPPDAALLQFGSSLEEDFVLAPFDVECSKAHVLALRDGGILSPEQAASLTSALETVAHEISGGTFHAFARGSNAEDVHGAIDARVRDLAPEAGELLHAGRSRNDQVATTLLLYCASRAAHGARQCAEIAALLAVKAREELAAGTLVAGTTHWQPAQPVLLAFWLAAAAEPFVRSARAFNSSGRNAMSVCPLGSAALAGSSLPLARKSAAAYLGFESPSRNAMDAIGNRDAALDTAHACVRALIAASRVCEELVIWCTPAFGYARLGDEASTGSSLMPQKRNPDPFELVRATAGMLVGRYAGALSSMSGIALSYHRDLQITKAAAIDVIERSVAALDAFSRALAHVTFGRGRMTAAAGEQYTVATDVADSLIAGGMTARAAHAEVGRSIRQSEQSGTPPAWPDARASVNGKMTEGSTSPSAVDAALTQLESDVRGLLA